MTIAQLLGIVVGIAIIIVVAWAEWASLKRMKPKKKGSAK